MLRRLPIYLLLDTSGSMAGEPIHQVINGVQMLVSGLLQDPHALETAWLSVITFGSEAAEASPLAELTSFQTPHLVASGTTSLGAGLAKLLECVRRDVKKSSPDQKGDWKPMVFIMTDGLPTDDWHLMLDEFHREKWGVVVGCAVDQGDVSVLKQIAGEDNVLQLDTSDSASLKAFFKWVTASIGVSSKSVDQGSEVGGLGQLPPPPPEISIV